jgi:hypothetical protein
MTYIQLHGAQLLAALSLAGLGCGVVGPMLPPGKLQNAVLALAHLLPGDVAQAVQKLLRGQVA